VPRFVITGKPLWGGDTLLLLGLPLALLLMPLKGKFGAAQPLADFFRRVGRGRILEMFMHFMQVLMLLFYGGHGSLL